MNMDELMDFEIDFDVGKEKEGNPNKRNSLELTQRQAKTAAKELAYPNLKKIEELIDKCLTINQVANVMAAARRGNIVDYEPVLLSIVNKTTANETEKNHKLTFKIRKDKPKNRGVLELHDEHILNVCDFSYTFYIEGDNLHIVRHTNGDGCTYNFNEHQFRFVLNDNMAGAEKFIGSYDNLYKFYGNKDMYVKLSDKCE